MVCGHTWNNCTKGEFGLHQKIKVETKFNNMSLRPHGCDKQTCISFSDFKLVKIYFPKTCIG